MLNGLLNWCKKNIFLVALVVIAGGAIFTFVQIQVLHMTSEPEFCAMCHPKKGFGPLAEVHSWEESSHAEAGVSCLDCHGEPGFFGYMKAKLGGLKDTYMELTISPEHKLEILSNPDPDLVPDTTCLFCHSDRVNAETREAKKYTMEFVHMRTLDGVKNPEWRKKKGLPDLFSTTEVNGMHFDHSLHVESMNIACNDCHGGMIHREVSKTERMNKCIECHEGSDAPGLNDCRTCHAGQLAMNTGAGVEWFKGPEGVMWQAGIECESCHTGVAAGNYRPTAAGCAECHDNSYVAVYKGWKKETRHILEEVEVLSKKVEAAILDAERAHRDTGAAWKGYLKAKEGVAFVKNDGTSGVHNNEYAIGLLHKSRKELNLVLDGLKKNW